MANRQRRPGCQVSMALRGFLLGLQEYGFFVFIGLALASASFCSQIQTLQTSLNAARDWSWTLRIRRFAKWYLTIWSIRHYLSMFSSIEVQTVTQIVLLYMLFVPDPSLDALGRYLSVSEFVTGVKLVRRNCPLRRLDCFCWLLFVTDQYVGSLEDKKTESWRNTSADLTYYKELHVFCSLFSLAEIGHLHFPKGLAPALQPDYQLQTRGTFLSWYLLTIQWKCSLTGSGVGKTWGCPNFLEEGAKHLGHIMDDR